MLPLHSLLVEWDGVVQCIADEWKNERLSDLRGQLALLSLSPHKRLRQWASAHSLDAATLTMDELVLQLGQRPCSYIDTPTVVTEWNLYTDILHRYAAEFIWSRRTDDPLFFHKWKATRTLDNLFEEGGANVVYSAARRGGYDPRNTFTWLHDSYMEQLSAARRSCTERTAIENAIRETEASRDGLDAILLDTARAERAALEDGASIILHHQRNTLPGVLAGLERAQCTDAPSPTQLAVLLEALKFDAKDESHRDDTCAFMRRWAASLATHVQQVGDGTSAIPEFIRASRQRYQSEIGECAALARAELRQLSTAFPEQWEECTRQAVQRIHSERACETTRTFWYAVRNHMGAWCPGLLHTVTRDVDDILSALPALPARANGDAAFESGMESVQRTLRRFYRAHLVCEQLLAWEARGVRAIPEINAAINALHTGWFANVSAIRDPWTELSLDSIACIEVDRTRSHTASLSERIRRIRLALVDRLRTAAHDQHSFIERCLSTLATDEGIGDTLQSWIQRDDVVTLTRRSARDRVTLPPRDRMVGPNGSRMLNDQSERQLRDTGHMAERLNQLHPHTLSIRDRLIQRVDAPEKPWTWSDVLVGVHDWFLLQTLLCYTRAMDTGDQK